MFRACLGIQKLSLDSDAKPQLGFTKWLLVYSFIKDSLDQLYSGVQSKQKCCCWE